MAKVHFAGFLRGFDKPFPLCSPRTKALIALDPDYVTCLRCQKTKEFKEALE